MCQLVVLTILKNIRQWEGSSHILWKLKNVPNHQPVNKNIYIYMHILPSGNHTWQWTIHHL